MRRRNKAGGRPPKTQRRKTARVARRHKPSAADATESIALLTRERDEALEQQTATSEVLKIIASSTGELAPVFQSMLKNATRICEAKFGILFEYTDGKFCALATLDVPPAFADLHREPRIWGPDTGLGQLARVKKTVHIHNTLEGRAFAERDPGRMAAVEIGGVRSFVAVPMLKDGEFIGAIIIFRQEVRPFTDKQIELVTNFAAQAVIAIENTRLFNELRQRTDDLSESLEQQIATSEVLRVISSSPGDLEPVFNSMLKNATRICEAKFGVLYRYDGSEFHLGALLGAPPALTEFQRQRGAFKPPPGTPLDRLLRTKEVIRTADDSAEEAPSPSARLAGAKSHIAVPMFKDDELAGAIVIYRQEVRPFTDKQVELVQNFAAQAVIAIENARLLNELRHSLQQQTATANVLKVISRSTFDLQTVLDTLVESAAGLCEAETVVLARLKGATFYFEATYGTSHEFNDFAARSSGEINRGTGMGRALADRKIVHILDVLADPQYTFLEGARLAGFRSLLNVPLLREGTPIGVIALGRRKILPFTEKQIELASTFADQAVIAIENVRLFDEVQARTRDLTESLQQQTATADVLKVISRSTFDLQAVLDTLVESAARLCDATHAFVYQRDSGTYRLASTFGFSSEYKEFMLRQPIPPGRGSLIGRTALDGKVVQILDALNDPEYTWKESQLRGEYRTMLGVPLLREGIAVGVLSLTRLEVKPFTDRQIELLTTFADQAAIAIENVRLFDSIEARTRELAKSLEDLRTAQDRLVQTEKLASLGQLTAGIAHEIKNPLNFVNNFSAVSVELIDELRGALAGANLDNAMRAEINEIAEMLQGNLSKVVQHGKRADSIVKNMLLHSRQGSGEHRPIDINAVVEESLNLAYHGARAEKQGFNITLEKSFDPAAGEVDLFPQEITRVLLNLISNGFYAATKRKAETDGGSYEPTLATSTKNLGDSVEIRIRDNGTGIPPEVKEKMFDPFFTTKPAGEGTGLGLSLSYDIIVKQHAGSIEVDTKPGEFTEFRIVLPRSGATMAKSGARV